MVPSPSMLRIGSVWRAWRGLTAPDSKSPAASATKQDLSCMFMIDIL
jgi:hypothetical protein